MQTVISAFDDHQTAQRAVDRLMEAGFDSDDVHIEPGADAQALSRNETVSTARRTDADDEDRGVLSSIGHFFTSLFGMDTPTGHAGTYTEAVRRGSSVVVVDVSDDEGSDRVAGIMNQMGAIDIDERADQWRAGGWDGMPAGQEGFADRGTLSAQDGTSRMAGDRVPGGQKVMDVVQEELDVGKREVDRGGVRVVQRMSEKPVRELIKLREERAVVERRNVDRPATQADLDNFEEGTIEVRESTEEPVVAKSARVVEEVRVGKQVQERTETINDTVRRKDVDVERIAGQPGVRERAVASDDQGALREMLRNERESSSESVDSRGMKDSPTSREK